MEPVQGSTKGRRRRRRLYNVQVYRVQYRLQSLLYVYFAGYVIAVLCYTYSYAVPLLMLQQS